MAVISRCNIPHELLCEIEVLTLKEGQFCAALKFNKCNCCVRLRLLCYIWPAFIDTRFSTIENQFCPTNTTTNTDPDPNANKRTLSQSRYTNAYFAVAAISLMLSRDVGSFSISNRFGDRNNNSLQHVVFRFTHLLCRCGVSSFLFFFSPYFGITEKPNQNIKCLQAKINKRINQSMVVKWYTLSVISYFKSCVHWPKRANRTAMTTTDTCMSYKCMQRAKRAKIKNTCTQTT